ncbi:NUDIX domain-containing protein [Streptomyces tateyamensis]|uniref:NUDIX domain-containing protein n=1 Tax=Streptomyces tateyamensis TaxID=565073 RepID=UPI0015E8C972|nr:NUDIX hydrolase [Streptomyces tateyamensis]
MTDLKPTDPTVAELAPAGPAPAELPRVGLPSAELPPAELPLADLPLADFLRTLPHGILFAAVHFTDRQGRPLLLESVYDPEVWQFAGGNLEFGSEPWECARREVLEETGLTLPQHPTPPLLALLFVAASGEWPFKVGVVFDGGELTEAQLGALVLDPAEHSAFAVHSLEHWRTVLAPNRLALLEAVTAARATGRAAYLHQLPAPRTEG